MTDSLPNEATDVARRPSMRKKRRRYIRFGLMLLTATLVYVVWRDKFPPYTPQVQARIYSDLPIPRSSTVLHHEEEWGFLHIKGTFNVIISVEERAFGRVVSRARHLGYRKLPSAGENRSGILRDFANPLSEGYYLLRMYEEAGVPSYTAIVVDTRTRRVHIELLYD